MVMQQFSKCNVLASMVDYCIPVIIVLFYKLLILGVSTLGENTRHNYDGFIYTCEYCTAHAIKIFLNAFKDF